MRTTDFDMFPRLTEEIFRLGYTNVELAKKIGCTPQAIRWWISGGGIPNAYYLARFYEIGADVIYILTGKRTRTEENSNHD